ncbi:uncharacterized protein PFLUO_LOCUS8260 [Penicillium psychrofluorescens]|uniref:uncharacterized protein n=1 Tax=Penicillium psychrofluorescens TaxID=3158075 RepID=UPI003CCD7DF3
MPLTDLPNEIIALLPQHIDNLETFTNASSSCRLLRENFSKTDPRTILRLAANSAPVFFSPHPHFLTAITARKASAWALGDESRTERLREAFQGGIEGLYSFCLEHSSLSMEEIRRTHLARFEIINVFSDRIDKMAGDQWMHTPNFWNGGVSSAYTLYTDAERAAFQIIIYGELFAASMDAFLDPEQNLPWFDIGTRLDYCKYCIPDLSCDSYDAQNGSPGLEVHPTGPYSFRNNKKKKSPPKDLELDQVAMRHITGCGRWRRMWGSAIREILPKAEGEGQEFTEQDEEEEHWRKKLLRRALQTQGLEGMQIITASPGSVSPEWVERTRRIKDQIDKLEKPPPTQRLGNWAQYLVFFAPDLTKEVRVTIATYSGYGWDEDLVP